MKITANIATHKGREEQLKVMLDSIAGQFDKIRIYDNDILPDKTDNGKFDALEWIEEPEYYFTLDDDIIYPSDYVERTLFYLHHYKCIVTYHGRILKEPCNEYYRGHQVFDFKGALDVGKIVDIGGTGVMAFNTRYFHPKGLVNSKDKRMSDIIFSLEVAINDKLIVSCPRPYGYLKQQEVTTSILSDRFGDTSRQVELAKKIIELKR